MKPLAKLSILREFLSELTRELRFLGKKYNIIVLTASQMNFSDNGGGGMARLYRGKVGKASHADIIMLIDYYSGNDYEITIEKARGRRIKNKNIYLYVDFSRMEIERVK